MKRIVTISAVLISLLSACDPGNSLIYSNIPLNIDTRTIPEAGVVNQPLYIMAHCTAPNGCWNNLHFSFNKLEDFKYELVALGNFESYGSCPDVLLTADTTITFTPASAGKYVVVSWITPYSSENDTIYVEPEAGR